MTYVTTTLLYACCIHLEYLCSAVRNKSYEIEHAFVAIWQAGVIASRLGAESVGYDIYIPLPAPELQRRIPGFPPAAISAIISSVLLATCLIYSGALALQFCFVKGETGDLIKHVCMYVCSLPTSL